MVGQILLLRRRHDHPSSLAWAHHPAHHRDSYGKSVCVSLLMMMMMMMTEMILLYLHYSRERRKGVSLEGFFLHGVVASLSLLQGGAVGSSVRHKHVCPSFQAHMTDVIEILRP